mmetsp:Transcript_20502/g.22271  ORF Transcript_20502/g.22271 Transcript_20502/m.22271 type:complete len:332 (-) Transcript_20502:534-1529(-)
MALKHAHTDQSLREAYHDAVRKGHELTKKIHSERNEESVDQSSGSLAATLEEMEQDQGGKLQQVEGKYSNLLKMEFMQRAIVKQREKLREEAVGAWVDDNLKVADISVAGKWDEKERHNYESRSKDSIHIEKSPVLTTSFDFHLQQSIVSKRDHQQRDNVVKPSLSGVQQDDLVALAFSGPNVEEEFQSLKEDAYDHEFGVEAKKLAVIKDVKAGWGDWAGPGSQAVSQRTLKRRDLALRQLENDRKLNSSTRRDFKKEGVIISEKRIKSAAKFKVGKVPFPFTSQEEYERSLQLPVGDEWNPSHVVKKITTAEVKTRPGRIILPINPLKA